MFFLPADAESGKVKAQSGAFTAVGCPNQTFPTMEVPI
jgi:hypothetical protein